MRRKMEAVLSFESRDEGLPKVIRDYRARYRAISQVLDDNPEILSAVHQDLLTLSEGDSSGREGDYTSENILRALLVQHLEGLPFRETVIRIGSDPFLQDFLRMRKRAVMDFTFLDRCFLVIRPQTWRRVNELLGRYGVAEEMVSTNVIRTDTTVVESNIHYPTESVIQRHEKLFGTRPEVLAADKGFCPAEAKFKELAEQVDTLAIPRRMRDFVDKVLVHWQAFRAGIEGTISGLKRAFRLIRCFFRGFRSFSAAVGLGVFCHNLIVLAEYEPD